MNFGVRGKLFTSFFGLILLIGGVGFVGWQNTLRIAKDAKIIHKDKVVGSINISQAKATLWNLHSNESNYLLKVEERNSIKGENLQLFEDMNRFIDNYSNTNITREERDLLAKVRETFTIYSETRPKFFELVDANKNAEAIKYLSHTINPTQQTAVEAFNQLLARQQTEADAKYQEIEKGIETLTFVLIFTLFVSLVIAIFLATLLGRNISSIIFKSVKNINTNSGKIATTVIEQERTLLEQSDNLNDTTTTIEELGFFALKSAQQAETSALGAQQALSLAEGGTLTVGQTIEGISELKDQVTAIANQIIRLSEQTAQISIVSDLVANLANQTNMLALNAGIEAARAGEQGKGFAVVAGEIRKLADQSRKSADQIQTLVNEVQRAINSTIMVTDEGTKKAVQGINLVEQTGETFNGIADAMNNVFLNTQQIAQSAKQQAVVVQQVVSAMNAINLGAKETVAGITNVKEATEDLNQAAKHLQAVI